MLPSSGDAWIGQKHILTEQKSVRRLIGYCPQHDALLDLLTVRDHLLLFGRLKGVSKQRLPGLVQKLLETLTLEPHEHKLAHTLSGGNKRKLSVAIALIGSPPLIFLDEPSTGVDPAARRFMWSVIANISTMRKECSVILTTHVMEEAEALCGRIGIMVGGRFRCLGSGQHLKGRFGQGYQLEFKLATPTAAQIEELHVKHFRVGTQGLSIPAPQIEAVCAAMGDQDRYRDISEEGDGHIVYHALQAHSEGCPAEVLMEWWLVGQAVAKAQVRFSSCRPLNRRLLKCACAVAALQAFINENFSEPVLLERHDLAIRYRLSRETPLAEVFRTLEEAKVSLGLEEYGVCQVRSAHKPTAARRLLSCMLTLVLAAQTSLEQIFNAFAAQQDEETGAVR